MPHSNYSLACIERAVSFIVKRIEDEKVASLDEIAEASGLSKFHFHRLYALATGETCHETMTRLRLSRAAAKLSVPETPVTEAAFSAGFASSQSFAKALRRVTQHSASELRSESDRLAKVIETLVVPQAKDGSARPDLAVKVTSLEPFEVMTVRTHGAYPELNANYGQLFEQAGDPAHVRAILGQPYGYIGEAGEDLRFDCSLLLNSELPSDLPSDGRKRIEGGAFALTRHLGAYWQLPSAVDRLYLSALSNPDMRVGHAPMLFHYLDDPEETAEHALRTDIYLPISLAKSEEIQ